MKNLETPGKTGRVGRYVIDNINRDSGIEIPEAWMPTIKKHNKKTVQQRTTEGTTSR